MMKVVTVNLPKSFIKMINQLIHDKGLYPSRSELIRVAVRDYILKKIEILKKENLRTFMKEDNVPELDDENLIKIPIKNDDGTVGYKTYNIIKRLE